MDLSVQIKGRPGKKEAAPGSWRDVSVPAGRLYNFRVGKTHIKIQCLEGALWVTRENDPADYLLTRCQSAVFAGGGKMVIQALKKGKFRIQSQ